MNPQETHQDHNPTACDEGNGIWKSRAAENGATVVAVSRETGGSKDNDRC